MKEKLANATTAALVLCALTLTALLVRKELFPAGPENVVEVREIDGWERFAREGHVLGRRAAPVTIVEFSDFQCPFCAAAHRSLVEVRRKYPDEVAVIYRHLPLAGHPHAFTAALATECAADQGAFEAYHDLLFAKQDSIGLVPWDGLARAAGVAEVGRFRECMERETFRDRVERDRAAAFRLRAEGTPTFLVNGKLFRGAVTAAGWDGWILPTLEASVNGR